MSAVLLRYLTFEDINELLPACPVVPKRKLELISVYVKAGGVCNLKMTMATISEFIKQHKKNQKSRAPVQVKDPMAYTAKFQIDSLETFVVKSNQCIDLNVRGIRVLTPNPSSNSSVRYYLRDGMKELFDDLLDMRKGQQYFNIDFFGPPGTGKSSLCWAVAEHLGSKGGDVIWAGRRSRSGR